ncbi:MAG: MATE family efflux transporter [Eubacteriales bacterium]
MEAAKYSKKNTMDMTRGSIVMNILIFALPLLVGNLFQQLYNLVDTWVIGQTGNNAAYAAVGSVGQIVNILIGFFLGLSSGAGVIISQYFGAKDEKSASKTVHTAMALTLIMAVFFTIVGITMTPYLLNIMLRSDGTAESNAIFNEAKAYLTIYFAGVVSLMIYNMGAGFLRAIGDSRRPFIFLIVAAVTNTLLDLLFVFNWGMGTVGVALATVIAQTLSAILTLITLFRSDTCVKLRLKDIKLEKFYLLKIIKVGFPAGVQMAITAFSNVFVQYYVGNAVIPGGVAPGLDMQEAALSSWTSYSKIDQFIFLPIQSIGLAVTTFVGQNLGVNDTKRARKGTYVAMGVAMAASMAIIVPIIIWAPFWASIFNSDPDIVRTSAMLLRCISPFYLCCCINQTVAAALRGSGNATAPMIIMLSCFVGLRQVMLFIISNFISNEIVPIGMSYPLGWLACAVTLLIYFRRFDMSRSRVVK